MLLWLGQYFPSRSDFALPPLPRGHSGMCGMIKDATIWRCYWPLVGKGRGCCRRPTLHETALQQRIVWLVMLIQPRLRNPERGKGVINKWTLNPFALLWLSDAVAMETRWCMHANSVAVQRFQGQGEGKGHWVNETAEAQLTSRKLQVLTASSITLEECAWGAPSGERTAWGVSFHVNLRTTVGSTALFSPLTTLRGDSGLRILQRDQSSQSEIFQNTGWKGVSETQKELESLLIG